MMNTAELFKSSNISAKSRTLHHLTASHLQTPSCSQSCQAVILQTPSCSLASQAIILQTPSCSQSSQAIILHAPFPFPGKPGCYPPYPSPFPGKLGILPAMLEKFWRIQLYVTVKVAVSQVFWHFFCCETNPIGTLKTG